MLSLRVKFAMAFYFLPKFLSYFTKKMRTIKIVEYKTSIHIKKNCIFANF